MIRRPAGPFARFLRTAAAGIAAGVVAGCDAGRPAAEPDAAAPEPQTALDETAVAAPPRLAGTWRLLRVERSDQNGDPLPDFVHRGIGQGVALGYLMYDDEHVGMVMQRGTAQPDSGASPDPDAALDAPARYAAYFGRYGFEGQEGYLIHRIDGSLDPEATGSEMLLRYELAEDRLVLLPPLRCPDSFVTERGCGYGTTGVQLRNVWERIGPASEVGPEARALLGFWEIDRIERRSADGADVPGEQYASGNLIYMPSGHMAVHLLRAGRRPNAGAAPTSEADSPSRENEPPPLELAVAPAPAAAGTAPWSYVSYFGPFEVLPDAGVVVHRRTGHVDPAAVGSEARRAFTLREGRLLLEPPVATVDGRTIRTTVAWNRLGAPAP